MLYKIQMLEKPNSDLISSFVTNCPPIQATEILADFMCCEIRKSLRESRKRGMAGWNTPQVENDNLMKRAEKNIVQGDYLDAAILLLMVVARNQLFEEILMGDEK